MTARTVHNDGDFRSFLDYESEEASSFREFDVGERIAPPLGASRSRRLFRQFIALCLLAGGVWSYVREPELWQRSFAMAREVAERVMARTATAASQEAAPKTADLAPAMPAPVETRDVAEAPGADAGIAAAPAAVTAEPDAAPAEAVDPLPAPLPRPEFDPADALKKRAFDAGLHPDVSRAVLQRLSAADFKNATHAIETALAKTPPSETFLWPRPAKARQAAFEVRFVTAAAESCRRYVVTITLDRWSTTSPALEKCGLKIPRGSQKTASQ